MISSTCGEGPGTHRLGATGSPTRRARIWSSSPKVSNGLRPVTISYNVAPNAYKSVRASPRFPITCSGAMYSGVPTWAENAPWARRAMPKSMIFTEPPGPSMMLPGFTSA